MKRHLRIILTITISMLFAFAIGAVSPASAAEHDLVVEGGTEGIDYTYADGVLTFKNNGSYTISMADNVSETSDRIVIKKSSDLSKMDLTMNSVTMKVEGRSDNIYIDYSTDENPLELNMHLVGDNLLSADGSPYHSSRNFTNLTVSGSGSLTIQSSEGWHDGYNDFNNGSFTLESGTVIMKNTTILATDGVYVKGGTLTVDSIGDTIYVRGEYVQTGGTVNLTAKDRCICVEGTAGESDYGVQILGGDTTMTTTGGGDYPFTIFPGLVKQKDTKIDTEGTVKIKSTSIGILLFNNGNLEMNNGILNIEAPTYGIYANGRGSEKSEFRVNGGETEITTTNAAIGLAATEKKDIIYGENYFHKNYDGEDAGDRIEVSDADILSDTGRSQKYVLITPAYRITYDLGIGNLPAGASNPVKYSRVDEITLKNPVSSDSDRPFIGWTGTGLDGLTMTVTIPEGSKGDRTYTANYRAAETYTITYDPAGGNWDGNTEKATESHKKGETIKIKTPPKRSGYTFKDWICNGVKYRPGDDYVVNGECTFTAVWAEDEGAGSDDSDNPKTGDDFSILGAALLMTASLLAAVFILRRRTED